MASKNFAALRANLMSIARTNGSTDDIRVVSNVLHHTGQFLANVSAMSGNPTVGSLENLQSDTVPVLNSALNIIGDIGVERVYAYVEDCKVPAARRQQVALEVLRILDNGVDRASVFEEVASSAEHMSLESLAGLGGAAMLRFDNRVGMEAFGTDIDRLQIDNRLNIVLTVLRSFTSVIDKLLPRVSEEGNVVTVKIPAPQVYDLAASNGATSAIRNNPANMQAMISLYRVPDAVSTTLKMIMPLAANDTAAVKSLFAATTSLATGVQSNLFDLSGNAAVYGYNAIDYTDLVAPGGRVNNIYVQASHFASGVTTTEVFQIPTRFHAQSVFTQVPNNMDSGDVEVNLSTSTMIRKGGATSAGAVSTMFAPYSDAVLQINVQFNASLNLKTANISGLGSATGTLKPLSGSTVISGATSTDFATITFSIVAFDTELFLDEENLRKTSIAVRMNTIERQFVIPMGRNFVVDYSLNQQASEEVASTVSNLTSLGNTFRGLSIIKTRLTDMANALAFESANPEMANIVPARMSSVAGTLCIPYVIQTTLDFADVTIAVFRESERLSELHGRLRARMLSALTVLCNKSLYLINLEPGEKPVFKVLTSQPIADQLFGIMDYHNELNDMVTAATGADYSMVLPNGYRLDIIKSNFVAYESTIMVIPVREAAPEHTTSFGTIRDRGTYTAQYTPVNAGAVARRVVSNSREIVFATNIIGCLFTVINLQANAALGPQS